MRKELIRDIFRNKRNDQLSITIPKKLLKKDGLLCPKKIRIKDWEWIE